MPELKLPDRPQHFAVLVPDSWAMFEVAHAPLAEARREAMSKASSAQERLTIDDLYQQARRATKAARRAGALWGAATATSFDDGLFVAQAMVLGVTGRPGADFTTPLLGKALAGPRDDGRGGEPLPQRVVRPVTVADGTTATRVTGLEDVQIAADTEVRMVVSHTFVPVPGTPDQYLLVTAMSPNLELEESVLELFAAIGDSFRFVDQVPTPTV